MRYILLSSILLIILKPVFAQKDSTKHPSDFSFLFNAENHKVNFDEFSNTIGIPNVNYLNQSAFYLSVHGMMRKDRFNYFFTAGFGGGVSSTLNDTVKQRSQNSYLGLGVGYDIIKNPRFNLIPRVGLRWFRIRLVNINNQNKLPLNQYLIEKEIDLRFHTLSGFAGMNFNYNIFTINQHKEKNIFINSMSIGIYGGYQFDLLPKTLLFNSIGNRMTHEANFKVSSPVFGFNIGIGFSTKH